MTSEDMTKLLREVKVPKIMFDQNTNTYYDTLSPDNFKGKKGSALLRNVHATIGYSVGIPMERLAYLQGRSLKAASESAEQGTYLVNYPHVVGDVDRGHASMFSSFFADAAKEAGFDIGERMPLPTERITTATPGYESYFDLPVAEKAPEPVKAEPVKAGPSPELQEQLDRNNLNLSDIIKSFGKKGLKVLAGAVGVETARQIVTEPAAFAAETAMEVGARAVGLGAAPAAAVPMIMQPTATAGPELSQPQPSMRFDDDDFQYRDEGFVNKEQADRNREEAAGQASRPMGFLSP